MKNSAVMLYEWICGDIGYDDIPWPKVHESVGIDAINWINSRDLTEAQMILEKDLQGRGHNRLWAEFYSPQLRTEFALRFGK